MQGQGYILKIIPKGEGVVHTSFVKYLLFLILCNPVVCFSLDPDRAITQYVRQIWKTEQGLPQKRVNDILQTKDGYLWLTTEESLVRFDGMEFTVFDSRNVPQIRAWNLPALAEDHEANLWIATEGAGLIRYKNGTFQSYTTQQGLSDNSVLSLAVDQKGSLWIGTQWGGLNHFQKGKVTVYKADDGTPGNRINTLYIDEGGDLWVGGDGLSRFRNGSFTTFTPADGLPSGVVTSITGDKKGTIWFGTWGGGITRFQNGKFFSFTTKDGLSHNEIRDIHYDRDGNLWVGTREGGLCRFKDGKWEIYSQPQGLSDNDARTIYEDREGSLWIGTDNQGLNRLKEGVFITFSSQEGFANDEVWCIYGDRKGNLWMGTRSGVVRFSKGKFTTFGVESGLSATNVVSVYGDSADRIWAGTRGGGLFVFENGRFTPFSLLEQSSSLFINCVYVDRSDNVWVGTADGLVRIQNGRLTHYTTHHGLIHDRVSTIMEDRSGNLWIGTRTGLTRMRNNSFQSYATTGAVRFIHEDSENTLWVGTIGGLHRLQSGKLKSYTTRDGLYDDTPFGIVDDNAGNLWISGRKGIFRFSKKDILNYDKGSVRSITSIAYGSADGIKDSEAGYGDPSVWKTKDGRLWFPTLKGITTVDPLNMTSKTTPAPTVIEKLFADQKYYDPTKRLLKIPPGQKRLEFHFTALSLFAPERIRFQYKLDGYDNEWQNAGSQRSASYTNIPPGNYTFRIKARSDEGTWNEPGASLAFYLQPRFYQTKWFYVLSVILIALIIRQAYRLRVKRIRSEFKAVLEERTRIAREFHDSLAQALAGIVMHLETAQIHSSGEQSKHHTERALNLARISIEEARHTVGALRKPPDYETDFASTLKEEILRQTSESDLEVIFEMKGNARNITEAKKTNLIRICQEAIHNVMKHAKARSIHISVVFNSDNVNIHIKDDGLGFDPDSFPQRAGHFGLTGMRERVKVIGGTIQIQSQVGQGTEIRLTVPLK